MRYGFAVGKVRVLATRLLDRSALERLVDAPSYAEQKRILSETPYGRFLEHANTAADVDEALDRSLDSVYAFLAEAGLPEAVQRFFRVRFDYTNLKGALKADALGVTVDDLLVDHGTVPREAFRGPLSKLPERYSALAREIEQGLDEADGETSLMAIDVAIDRALYAELREIAVAARSRFLQDLAARLSDVANLKSIVRARNAGLTAAAMTEMIVDGGSMSSRDLAALYRLPHQDMLAGLERRLGLKGSPLVDAHGMSDLDVIVDNVIVETIRRAKRAEPGPEDVIAYVRARESEVQVLRVALLGKMAGLDSETLHRRMRASFL